MATPLRNTDPLCSVLASAINSIKAQIGAGSSFHLDRSELTVTPANASDLATSLALCNFLIGVYRFHYADVVAHKIADAGVLPLTNAAVDLATAITAANAIKAEHATHIADTALHYNADSTNTIAAANASDQSSLNTLLNELKTDLNAHMVSGPAGKSIRLIPA